MDEINLRSSGPPPKKSAVDNAPELVFVAKDGNCFMQGDSNRTQYQHLNEVLISEDRATEWKNVFKRRHIYFHNKKIPYIFLLCPDKQSIFWENIYPDRPDNRNSLSIFNDIVDEPRWIDPVCALKEASKTGLVYPLTDSHWDARGAYIAYCEMANRTAILADHILQEGQDFQFSFKDISGDLGNKFSPKILSQASALKKIKMKSRKIYSNGVDRNGQIHIYKKQGLTNIGVLCGDSYTQSLAPFFAEHFGILLHLRGSTDLNFIADLNPALVIGSLAERFFLSSPVSNDDAPIEMFFIRRLSRGEMKPDQYNRIRCDVADTDLPSPLLAMVARNDALGDMLNSAEPTERQMKYMSRQFVGATSGDVLTACYLSWAWRATLDPSWAEALLALPASVQDAFRSLCPLG